VLQAQKATEVPKVILEKEKREIKVSRVNQGKEGPLVKKVTEAHLGHRDNQDLRVKKEIRAH